MRFLIAMQRVEAGQHGLFIGNGQPCQRAVEVNWTGGVFVGDICLDDDTRTTVRKPTRDELKLFWLAAG